MNELCKRPGCSGTIEDGYCNVLAPRGRASIFRSQVEPGNEDFFVPRLNLGTRIWEVPPPLVQDLSKLDFSA